MAPSELMCTGYIIQISNLKPINPYKFNSFRAEADKPQIHCIILRTGSRIWIFCLHLSTSMAP